MGAGPAVRRILDWSENYSGADWAVPTIVARHILRSFHSLLRLMIVGRLALRQSRYVDRLSSCFYMFLNVIVMPIDTVMRYKIS